MRIESLPNKLKLLLKQILMGTIILTRESCNKEVSVLIGQDVILGLLENPTTGYVWKYELSGDKVRLTGNDYKMMRDVSIGKKGARFFNFKVVKAGAIDIVMNLTSAVEKNGTGIEQCNIRLLAR